MDEQGGYAPRSPDLSAYHGSGPLPPTLASPSQEQYQPPAFPAYAPPPPYQPPYGGGVYPAAGPQPPYQPPPGAYPPGMVPMPSHGYPPAEAPLDADDGTGRGRGRKPKRPKPEEPTDEGLPPAPGVVEGIEVKTKFPVARIKRIMQADEDVGKVAQVTPTAVSKALELFMISLVTKSAAQARAKSAKKVTAAHLKQVIQQDESFDFLSEIVAKIPDAPASKREAKAEDSDEGEGKKRKGRAKRKVEEGD